jgi:hypothetical protein
MLSLRPSSPVRFFEPRTAEKPEHAAPSLQLDITEPFIDEGLPIPETYAVNIMRAMLQDPFRVFIYWELREESITALTHYFPVSDIDSFRVTMRLLELSGKHQAYFEVPRQGRYWMMVFPDREYEFELGVRSPQHGYIPMVRSNRIRTPRGTVSPIVSREPEYALRGDQFVTVLDLSGFSAQQTLDLTLAAMPGANEQDGKREELLSRMPASLRAAVVMAARRGKLTRELIEALPEPLRSMLLELVSKGDEALAAAAMMHYLPEVVRELLDDDRELIGPHSHPIHLTPRFFAGGTEHVMPPASSLPLPGRPSSLELIRK